MADRIEYNVPNDEEENERLGIWFTGSDGDLC